MFSRMTVQTELLEPLVELHPDQLAKAEPPVAAAVNVIVDPVANWLLHEDGEEQLIAGPVTVPVPLPAKLMVRIGCGPAGVHPELAGPFTTMCAKLLVTRLGLS